MIAEILESLKLINRMANDEDVHQNRRLFDIAHASLDAIEKIREAQPEDSVSAKKLEPVLWPKSGDLPKTVNCPVCGTICHE